MDSPRGRPASGFTLLEMLVALAIFALIGVAAYSGLDQVLRTRAAVEAAAGRLQRVQLAMYFLEQDLAQAVGRPIRDEFGLEQPALLLGEGGGEAVLRLTRTGRDNPLERDRPALQRLAYDLRGEQLWRRHWQRLDRSGVSEPREALLLEAVVALTLRALDDEGQWQERWPPLDADPAALPRALELRLELADWGEIRRLIPLAGVALQIGGDNG